MKIELVACIVLSVLSTSFVFAHPYAVCANTVDHLHVKEVNLLPDPPKGGHDFTAEVIIKPENELSGGKAQMVAKVLGLKVFAEDFDICEKVKCPIPGGKESKVSFSYPMPQEIPEHVEVTVQVTIRDTQSNIISCIVTKVDTYGKDNAADIEKVYTNNMLKSYYDPVKSNVIGWSEKTIRFLFDSWLHEFAHIAEIDWFPVLNANHEKTMGERLIVFAMNLEKIVRHNNGFKKGKFTYSMALNQFAHLENKEFSSIYLNGISKKTMANKVSDFLSKIIRIPNAIYLANSPKAESSVKQDSFPVEFDWVTKGAVTPVKNQGSCGSCWAFSAIAAIEGAYFVKYGELKSFSEQQLVSCDNDCYGCGGGLMDLAFQWIQRNGGICSEADYPYVSGGTGGNGLCRPGKCSVDPKTKIQSFVDVDHTDDSLIAAVLQQPIAVAIEADQYAFQFYSGGVLTGECGDKLDHGVTVVGYGVYEGGTPFWKIKNSWGPSWGIGGYILIQRGKSVPTGDDECGILSAPSYPVL